MANERAIEWPGRVRWLHWGTTLLLTASFALAFTWDIPERRATQLGLLQVHRDVGVLVLFLSCARLFVRARTQAPAQPHPHPKWMTMAARLAHGVLYLTLIALPLIGWMLTNARGKPVHLLGFNLPLLIARDRDLAESLEEIHWVLGCALLAMIALHIAAALWHHWRARDGVLRSMLGMRLYKRLFG